MTFADSEQKSSLTFFFIDFRDPFYVKAGGNSTALDHKSHGIQTPPCASGWCLKVIEVSKHFIIFFVWFIILIYIAGWHWRKLWSCDRTGLLAETSKRRTRALCWECLMEPETSVYLLLQGGPMQFSWPDKAVSCRTSGFTSVDAKLFPVIARSGLSLWLKKETMPSAQKCILWLNQKLQWNTKLFHAMP